MHLLLSGRYIQASKQHMSGIYKLVSKISIAITEYNNLPKSGINTHTIYYCETMKYADDLVIMAKEETVLQVMMDKLIEIGSCYGMEMNVEETKVMRISRQPSPVTIMIDQKQLENVECFKYLGRSLTNDRI